MVANKQTSVSIDRYELSTDSGLHHMELKGCTTYDTLPPRSELSETHRRIGSEIILFTQPGGRNITPEKVNRLSERLSRG